MELSAELLALNEAESSQSAETASQRWSSGQSGSYQVEVGTTLNEASAATSNDAVEVFS